MVLGEVDQLVENGCGGDHREVGRFGEGDLSGVGCDSLDVQKVVRGLGPN